MSVNDVRASLSIYGEREYLTAAAVTAALGIQPTSSHEFGDPAVSKSPAIVRIVIRCDGAGHAVHLTEDDD